MRFTLFRIKVLRDLQQDAFATEATPQEILRDAIVNRPELMYATGAQWSIGNPEVLTENDIYFRVGKISRRVVQIRDEHGDYRDAEAEMGPNAPAFVHIPLEVCAIAHNAELADGPAVIARHLRNILNKSPAAARYRATFEVSELSEPAEFFAQLEEAYAVKRLTVYFTRPNPTDLRSDFHKAMEELADEADAVSGSTTIRGPDLDRELVRDLSRSATATGDDVVAFVQREEGTKPVKATLKGTPATLHQASIQTPDERLRFFDKIRDKYRALTERPGRDSS